MFFKGSLVNSIIIIFLVLCYSCKPFAEFLQNSLKMHNWNRCLLGKNLIYYFLLELFANLFVYYASQYTSVN